MTGRFDAAALRQPVALLAVAAVFGFFVLALAQRGLLVLFPALLVLAGIGLLFARYPLISFAFLILSVPFQRLGSEGATLPVTLTQLMFPVAFAGFLIAYVNSDRKLRGHVLLAPFALLIVLMLVSTLQAESLTAGLAEVARWSVALAAFWLALQIVVGGSDRRLVMTVGLLAAGGVFEATVGVVQSVVGLGPFQVSSGVSRAYGTFGRPNSYAGFLEMTLFPTAAMALWYAGETWRALRNYSRERLQGFAASQSARRIFYRNLANLLLFTGSAAVILGGIVASLSRGAWLGVGVAALIMALLVGRVTRIVTLTATVALAAVLLTGQGALIPEDFRDRVTDAAEQIRPFDVRTLTITDENFAAAERVAHWQTGWDMFQDHPALGVGAGNFNVRFEEYSVRESFRNSQGHAHNYYIHTLAETGLAGLLVYLTLLGAVIFLALRVLLSTRPVDGLSRLIVLGAFGSIIAVAVHNMFENLHVLNLGIIIGLHWALVIAGQERWRMLSATDG